jgi:5-methylcytosine-specific restriction endonuclease McrA
MIRAQKGVCFYCDQHMSLDDMSRDHLFPKSHGFSLQGNLVLAHHRCNSDKANRYPTIAEILKWSALYGRKHRKNLLVKHSKSGKPRFKLKMTQDVVDDWCM